MASSNMGHMVKEGEWGEYNEKLVKRGEISIDIEFLEDMRRR